MTGKTAGNTTDNTSGLTTVLGRLERAGEEVAVVFDRTFGTNASDLWQACTDPVRLQRWFAPVSGDLRPGGEFTIHFDDDNTPRCRLVTCEEPRRLVWEWPLGGVQSIVTAEITGEITGAVAAGGDGARLVLRHERVAASQAAGYAAGWDTYVRRLDADLTGHALPDWDATWSALHAIYSA